MKQKLELKLIKKYPNLFRDYKGDMRQTCLAWGMEHGDGWYKLLDEIGQKLTDIDAEKYVVADQVKEKFGGLRFYYHTENLPFSIFDWIPLNHYLRKFWYHKYIRWIRKHFTRIRRFFYKSLYEKIDDIIDTAENKSYVTCEICGEAGKTTGSGWLKTLCNGCNWREYINEKYKSKYENRNISK